MPMPSAREARLRQAVYCRTRLREANELYLRGEEALAAGLKSFDTWWPNINLAHSWTAAHAMEDDEAAKLCSDYPYIGEMLIYLRLQPRDRIAWGEAALAAAQRIGDQYAESAHLHKLALAFMDRGEVSRAIEYLEKAAAINRDIERHDYEAADLGALGLAYAALEEHRQAIELYRRALAIYRTLDTTDARWGEGIYLSNLGESYTAIGKPRTAVKLHERALEINRGLQDRRSEGYALGNLGRAYAALGEHARALEAFAQNLAIAREMVDPQSEGYALFGSSLSRWEAGERAEAMATAEKALRIFEQIEDVYIAKVRKQLEQWREQDARQTQISAP